MARMHTDEESKTWIEKRAPEHVRRYVDGLESTVQSKQEYIEAMENGLFGEREEGAEFFYTEYIRSLKPEDKFNRDKRWLPKYTDVGIVLDDGSELQIGRAYQKKDVLEIKLGYDTRGEICVVSSGSHGSLHFKVIKGD